MSLAAGASSFRGFERWAFAHDHIAQHRHNVDPVKSAKNYTPQFFTPEEYTTITILTELIIPSHDTPGAREAGVSEFVDFMAASDPKVQYRFRYGLSWMDAHTHSLRVAPFTIWSEPFMSACRKIERRAGSSARCVVAQTR
ncbi:MAG TPA: gluconate 2-dehydrogenase subunit 3 family protein [Pyrinomonadaceae bacterium]|nr:gluconate 2-dehydrogenase subunit 3 family protein [Pyrinomonadaceae bacterium]